MGKGVLFSSKAGCDAMKALGFECYKENEHAHFFRRADTKAGRVPIFKKGVYGQKTLSIILQKIRETETTISKEDFLLRTR